MAAHVERAILDSNWVGDDNCVGVWRVLFEKDGLEGLGTERLNTLYGPGNKKLNRLMMFKSVDEDLKGR